MSSSKKSYSRYFIILQEDEKGYSVSQDKQISGYAKVETKNDKCKVSYYVQNIKKDKNNCYMMLICNKKDCKKIINLGVLNIDDNGRADVTYEYNLDNIGATGIGIDKVGGAAVVKIIGDKIVYLMHGFASSDIPQGFKNYVMIHCKQEETKEITKDMKTKEKEETKKKEKEESMKKDDKKKDSMKKEEKKDKDEKEKQNNKEDKNKDVKKDKDKDDDCNCPRIQFDDYEREIDKQISEEKRNEEKKIEEKVKENPKGSMGEFFKNAMMGFEEVKDICPDMKKCKWYKIPVEELDSMCNMSNYNKYTIAYYPMLNYFPYIKKYGHYMIGLMYDDEGNMKYLVYAIPGTKEKNEQPYGGKSGFVTWMAKKSENVKECDMGYWIMFYDFRNSMIVVPMK